MLRVKWTNTLWDTQIFKENAMIYSESEILQYIDENDVKFVKLAFCDVNGKMKNISILSSELAVTFEQGVMISASKIAGFSSAGGKELFLFPDVQTMTVLPWRPQQGRVIRMYCYIRYADGTPFEGDGRYFLKKAMKTAVSKGYCFRFGTSCEFSLYNLDENGQPTQIPHDYAGYCDIAPDDKGENIRRDVCLTLEQMGIHPVSSRHECGNGQHEIDFNASSALKAADTFLSFKSAVKSVAERNGVYASFMPKPIRSDSGNGMHISFNIFKDSDFLDEKNINNKPDIVNAAMGVMKYIKDFTMFTNSTVNSYSRLGEYEAPKNINWSSEEGDFLIKLSVEGDHPTVLRAADCVCNPYYVIGLIIYASLEGIEEGLILLDEKSSETYGCLPENIYEAVKNAESSEFLKKYIPDNVFSDIIEERKKEWNEYNAAESKEEYEKQKYFYKL